MTYDGNDTFTLSSGRSFYAHSGIVGLGPETDETWHPTHGYDGELPGRYHFSDDDEPLLTKEERAEIAEFMIARWRRWAGQAPLAQAAGGAQDGRDPNGGP